MHLQYKQTLEIHINNVTVTTHDVVMWSKFQN